MRVIEIIRHLRTDEINLLAKLLGVPHRKTDQLELTKRLIAEAYTPENVQFLLNKLSVQERLCAEMLACLFSSSPSGMNLHEGAKKINDLLGVKGQGEKMVRLLQSRGIVFLAKHYWHDVIIVPDEVWPVIVRELAERIVSRVQSNQTITGTVQVLENRSLSLHHDLLTLLASFAHDNVEITQKGRISCPPFVGRWRRWPN
jgi:hypothetical protein